MRMLLPPSDNSTQPQVSTEFVIFISLILLFLIPMWLPAFPPMADLGQHAGQITAIHELWFGSEHSLWERSFYINYKTPYLLGYSLGAILSLLVSP